MGVVEFEQLTALLQDGSIVLVDVRNESELREDGKIPGSHNIALPELTAAFQLTPEDFKQKYGFDQPSKDNENLILTCRLQLSLTVLSLSFTVSGQAREHIKARDSWRSLDSRKSRFMKEASWTGRQKVETFSKASLNSAGYYIQQPCSTLH